MMIRRISLGFALAFALLLPAQANADVTVKKGMLQQGLFHDDGCRPVDAKAMFDRCSCIANIEQITITSADHAAGAEALNKYFAGWSQKHMCPGKQTATTVDMKKLKKPFPNQQTHLVETKFAAGNVVSLLTHDTAWTGGAGDKTSMLGSIGNVATGKLYEVNDLIDPANFAAVNKYIYEYLYTNYRKDVFAKPKTASYLKDGKCQNCSLYLAKDGLHMVFNEYAVGPGSSGNLDVPLPPKYIKDKDIISALAGK